MICTNRLVLFWHYLRQIKVRANVVLILPFWGLVLLCPAAVPPAGSTGWWLYWYPPGESPGYNASTQTGDLSPHTAQTAPAGMCALGLGARETGRSEGGKGWWDWTAGKGGQGYTVIYVKTSIYITTEIIVTVTQTVSLKNLDRRNLGINMGYALFVPERQGETDSLS